MLFLPIRNAEHEPERKGTLPRMRAKREARFSGAALRAHAVVSPLNLSANHSLHFFAEKMQRNPINPSVSYADSSLCTREPWAGEHAPITSLCTREPWAGGAYADNFSLHKGAMGGGAYADNFPLHKGAFFMGGRLFEKKRAAKRARKKRIKTEIPRVAARYFRGYRASAPAEAGGNKYNEWMGCFRRNGRNRSFRVFARRAQGGEIFARLASPLPRWRLCTSLPPRKARPSPRRWNLPLFGCPLRSDRNAWRSSLRPNARRWRL